MRVTLLGPLSCRYEGRILALGGLKQRAVFALLAVDAGRVVSVDRLVDDLWPDDPPAHALVTVRAYVSRLRKLLGPTPAQILTRRPGWVLDLGSGTTDLAEFSGLLTRSRATLDAGGPRAAATATTDLERALALWSGSALGDLGQLPFARDAARRLGELHDAAVELLLDARLANGDDTSVVELARQFVADRPYRERAWASLMIGLYRSGRQAEALEAFTTLRRVLADDLGLDPSPDLRSLEQQLLRHDPALLVPSDTAAHDLLAPGQPPSRPEPIDDRTDGRAPHTAAGWPLVGRDRPLAVLRARVDAAAAGDGGLVVLSAPAGAGKTTLLRTVEEGAVAGGCRVLHGTGLAGGAAPALWPWVTALGELLDAVPGLVEGRWGPTDPAAAAVGALGAAQSSPATSGGAPLGQTVLFRGVIDVLREARSRGPLVVLVDDAHWVDADSWTLLALACDELAGHGLLVVAALRSDEPGADVMRSAGPVRRDLVVRIELDPLSDDAVATLVEAIDGQEPEPGVVDAVLHRTGGNALFVTELLQLLSAERRLTTDAVGSTVPDQVRDVLERRLERLSPTTVALLRTASLIAPGPFDVDLLTRVVGRTEEQIVDECDEALLAGLLEDDGGGRLALSHGLLRETLAARLSGPRRVHLHAKIAAALEQRDPRQTDEVLEVARHLVLAAPAVGPAAAVPYLVSAATDSLRRSAAGAAFSLLTTALEMVEQIGDARLQESSRALVEGQLDTVRMFAAAFGDDPAESPPDRVPVPTDAAAAGAWVGTVVGWAVRGHYPWAVAEASDVLAGRPNEVVEHLARYVRGTMGVMAGERQLARHDLDLLKAGVLAAGGDGLPGMPFDFVDDVYAFRGLLAHEAGDDRGADDELAALVAWSRSSPTSRVKCDFYLSLVAAMRREPAAARTYARRCQQLARELDFAVFEHQLDVVCAWADALDGDPEGPTRADRALAAYRDTGMVYFEPSYLLLVAEAYAQHGHTAIAQERVEESAACATLRGELYLSPRLGALAADLASATGPSSAPPSDVAGGLKPSRAGGT